MQLLNIDENVKLKDLTQYMGNISNQEAILRANDLPRTPNIGQAYKRKTTEIINTSPEVPWQRKSTILNDLAGDSDIYERAAMLGNSEWKLLDVMGVLPGTLKVPESVKLPQSANTLGNGQPVEQKIHRSVSQMLENEPHEIDPSAFNEYSAMRASQISDTVAANQDSFQWFPIPWGDVTLYSSLDDDKVDFPVYPEEVTDSRVATYTTMPDVLFQYEPWQIYQSSGPRTNSYTFEFHRDMWTGDHRDGRANELIRFCEACCYPEFNGSLVNTSTVTLYVKGKPLISGIMTQVDTQWDGPIGLDGWYLHCKLTITITEIAKSALNYNVVKSLPLIGG